MKGSTKWLAIIGIGAVVLCLGLCAAVGIALRYGTEIYTFLQTPNLPRTGSHAPDFTLQALDGGSVTLSQFKGKPVLLTFAASWCPDCRAEAPFQQDLHTQHPDLVMLLVDSQEHDGVVHGFADDFGMTFPVLLDGSGSVSNRYRIFAIPTTFFIDEDGIIRYVLIDSLTPELAAEKLPLIGVEP